jgi:hypothetical protein
MNCLEESVTRPVGRPRSRLVAPSLAAPNRELGSDKRQLKTAGNKLRRDVVEGGSIKRRSAQIAHGTRPGGDGHGGEASSSVFWDRLDTSAVCLLRSTYTRTHRNGMIIFDDREHRPTPPYIRPPFLEALAEKQRVAVVYGQARTILLEIGRYNVEWTGSHCGYGLAGRRECAYSPPLLLPLPHPLVCR